MDKDQAQRIVRETLESPFDKGRFTYFIKNLLNSIEEAPCIRVICFPMLTINT